MAIFEGAGVALVTPFKENGSVNYEVLESLIEEQIAGGTDCIVAMGTTGESATTSEEEHIQVIRFVCEVVNGRIPVVAGTGSNCTQTAVELSVEAEEAGADGVLLVSPYYNKATQNGLKAHFTKIANSIKIPAILYNVPSRTGVNIAPRPSLISARMSRISSESRKRAETSPQLRRSSSFPADMWMYIPEMMTRSFRCWHSAQRA